MSRKALDYESINENVKKAQYAVRGELYLRASELQKEGKRYKVFVQLYFCQSYCSSSALKKIFFGCLRSLVN